jgi:hypothetical protein
VWRVPAADTHQRALPGIVRPNHPCGVVRGQRCRVTKLGWTIALVSPRPLQGSARVDEYEVRLEAIEYPNTPLLRG